MVMAKRKGTAKPRTKIMSAGAISRQLAKQAQAAQARRNERALIKRAKESVLKFKPRKADRGGLVMVSSNGKRNPQSKGKRGYLVYVTKTGKKWLVKQKGQPLKPRKITQLTVPEIRMRKAARKFQEKRRIFISHGKHKVRPVVKGEGEIVGEKELVNKLTEAIYRVINRQESHRLFLVQLVIRVELPDGQAETFSTAVEIGKADHVAIERGGIRNFVRKKVWAFLAIELAMAGYVSQESNNHIRRAARNKGRRKSSWTDGRGDRWKGIDKQVVRITHIEYKIEQLNR
jgi:hypothetical protein